MDPAVTFGAMAVELNGVVSRHLSAVDVAPVPGVAVADAAIVTHISIIVSVVLPARRVTGIAHRRDASEVPETGADVERGAVIEAEPIQRLQTAGIAGNRPIVLRVLRVGHGGGENSGHENSRSHRGDSFEIYIHKSAVWSGAITGPAADGRIGRCWRPAGSPSWAGRCRSIAAACRCR